MTEKNCFSEGAAAFHQRCAGVWVENPYQPGTTEYEQWETGLEDAYQDRYGPEDMG